MAKALTLKQAEKIWNKGPGDHNPRWQEALDWLNKWSDEKETKEAKSNG